MFRKLLLVISILVILILTTSKPVFGEAWDLTNAPDYLGDPSIIQNQGFKTWLFCPYYWPTYTDNINVRFNSTDPLPAERYAMAFNVQSFGGGIVNSSPTLVGSTLTISANNSTHWTEVKSKQIRLLGLLASSWTYKPNHVSISIGEPDASNKYPSEAGTTRVYTNADNFEFKSIGDDDKDGIASSIRLALTGKPGLKDYFAAFLPQALLAKWGLASKNLAVLVDGNRVAASVAKSSDLAGLIIKTSLTYPVSSVSIGKPMNLSLTLNNKSIKRGQKVKLFGWYEPDKGGVEVDIFRKFEGGGFEKIGSDKTNKQGYYVFKDKPEKSAWYKVIAKKGKKILKSKIRKVAVK